MRITADLGLASAPHRARGGWHPGWLFRTGVMGTWFDPSDRGSLFQDAAGTIPVLADGQPVGRMLDKSGQGHHATQPVAAARPTWRTNGRLGWLEFDGVDDRMIVAAAALSSPVLSICAGLRYMAGNLAWGALRSRLDVGTYCGLSHPSFSGPTSNAGGQSFVNGLAAPGDRIALRGLLLTPAVLRVEGAQAAAFSGQGWQILSYWNTAPPAGQLFGYLELQGQLGAEAPRLERWMARKTGVAA